jgi:large subunit ribosomal protein L4e
MKSFLLSVDGKNLQEIELPNFFNTEIREDIISKVFQASLKKQPYSPNIVAGMQHSASGKLRHARRKWKTTYGYGISRVPRKLHTRRGSRFFWVAATIASARGGRRAHPPKVVAMLKKKKINKKEKIKALLSAIAATASFDTIKKKYSRLAGIKRNDLQITFPLVFESKVVTLSTKQFRNLIKGILGNIAEIAEKEKKQRAGKGKLRGRRYKKNRGMLIVTASDEKLKCKYFDSTDVKTLNLEKLAPGGVPGRLVAYTEKAIVELANRFGETK